MATADDAVRAMRGMHTKDATKIAYEQTGIEPGFDPATGITWREDGRARYRTAPTAGGTLGLLASGSTSSQITYANGDDTLIAFDEDYDPSSLYVAGVFTAAQQARYVLRCQSCYVHPNGSGYSANTGCLLWVYRNTSDSMGALDDGTVGAAVSSTSWFMLLHGDFQLALDVGETVEVHFQNNSGASRKLNIGATLHIYKVS